MDPNAALSHFVSTMTLPEHSVLNKKKPANYSDDIQVNKWRNG